MAYEIKPFEIEDLGRLIVNKETEAMISFVGREQMAFDLKQRGPAYTVFCNGEPSMIAGIAILWSGAGEGWAMFGAGYRQHGRFIHRVVVKYIKKLVEEYSLKRLQAVVLKDHWAGIEWVDRLGFKFEGEMEKYFQGKTYLRYAKFYPEGS